MPRTNVWGTKEYAPHRGLGGEPARVHVGNAYTRLECCVDQGRGCGSRAGRSSGSPQGWRSEGLRQLK